MQIHWRRLASPETDYEFLWLVVSLGTGAALAASSAARFPTPRCIFHSATGWPCPTCGTTRAALQFLHGHFGASLLLNPLAFFSFCGLLMFDLYALAVLVARAPRLRVGNFSDAESRFVRIAAILLLVGNWLYLLILGPV